MKMNRWISQWIRLCCLEPKQLPPFKTTFNPYKFTTNYLKKSTIKITCLQISNNTQRAQLNNITQSIKTRRLIISLFLRRTIDSVTNAGLIILKINRFTLLTNRDIVKLKTPRETCHILNWTSLRAPEGLETTRKCTQDQILQILILEKTTKLS